MDDAQVDELRKWSLGLAEDGRPEVRAAGKAIHLLATELQATRSQLLEERLIRQAFEQRAEAEESAELLGDLRRRLGSVVRRRTHGEGSDR